MRSIKRSRSAGSHPKGEVNPLALQALQGWDYPAKGFRSKGWEAFAAPGAPVLDFVFTVCDSAACEACPIWPGHPMTARWGIEDPAAVEGTEIDRLRAFNAALHSMRTRISLFTALPLKSLDDMALGSKLRDIGRSEGTTSPAPDACCTPKFYALTLRLRSQNCLKNGYSGLA